jgi:PAS domain S-box-containing protein
VPPDCGYSAASCAELSALQVAAMPARKSPSRKAGPAIPAATPVTTKMPAPTIAPKPTPTASSRPSMPDGSNPTISATDASEPTRDALVARVRELEGEVHTLRSAAAANDEIALTEAAAEHAFRALANASPAILWVTDDENRCTFLSRHWYEFTGQGEGEGLGFGWLDAVHPDERERTGRAFVRAAAERRPFSLDHRVRRKDGEYRWVIDEGRPQFDDSGEWRGYVGLVIDVHDRRVAREDAQRSEARYRALFEAIDAGFCVIQMIYGDDGAPQDYRFVEMNRAFRAHTGLDNAIGRTARQLLPGLEEHWFRIYGEIARSGEPRRFEEGSDTMGRWFDVFAFPALAHGPDHVALVFTDITSQRRADSVLRRSAEQLRALALASIEIQSAQDVEERLQVIAEQAREVIGAHTAVARLTGDGDAPLSTRAVSVSDRHRRSLRECGSFPESGIEEHVMASDRTIRLTQEELERHPDRRLPDDASTVAAAIRGCLATPLIARDGTNIGLIQLSDAYEGEFTESDEAILLQLALLASVAIENAGLFAEARRANEVKSQFLASMSHELRTPLNAMGGYVDLLDLGVFGDLTDAQKEAVSRIDSNQRHLTTLINDILSFARLEAGRIELTVEEVPTADVLRSVEPLVSPLASARGVAYRLEPPEPGLTVRADDERLRQVLLNLVGNAIKFTPHGGSVTVSCDSSDDRVLIHVRDDGIGIEPDEHARIFDPFRQADRRLNQPREGVGLGLSISRDLAQMMGGDISVQSVPGEGSTFTISLPRGRSIAA